MGTADQYARKAAELGQSHLALTDHGTLSGALHHIEACQNHGVIPICGVEAYFRPDAFTHNNDNKEYWHLVLLAKNLKGWRNLMRITSIAYADGFYYKPCVDWDMLETYSEGLIASTACISGRLSFEIERNGAPDQYMQRMKKIFGDDLYVEIMPHDIDRQRAVNPELISLANHHGVPVIATVDAHYPYQEWGDTQDVLGLISRNSSFAARQAKRDAGEDVYGFDLGTLYLMGDDDVRNTFSKYHPNLHEGLVDEAIKNTHVLAESITPFLIDKQIKLPRVKEVVPEDEVVKWCQEGLERIDKTEDEAYRDRMAYELDILRNKGVLDYFYIIGDLVRWAKRQRIRVGAGRGSAAGCLVSYLIGITALDPIAHDLLFERFLNPDRKGLPDIDLDFQSSRRDEIKTYLGERWGHDHIADIVAHQTYGPRSALQAVARVYDQYKESMKATAAIDPQDRRDLDEIAEIDQQVAKYKQLNPEAWKHACRLQGQVKTQGKHAAGVVITDKPVTEYMPTMRAKDGSTVTAWNDSAEYPIISDYGFLKLDALGLSNLDMQDYSAQLIEKRHGKVVDLDALPVASDPNAGEPEVLELFGKGLTLGVFQFEGQGITNMLRQIKPTWFGDITAANALFRPGPLDAGVAHDYGRRKNGKTETTYWHKSVEPYMAETYGVLAYQEQVMRICQGLGGFTPGMADDMRKAMGKLYRLPGDEAQQFMQRYWSTWCKGCADAALNDTVRDHIWEQILAFGGYGFNKSHSACYAFGAYQDMWLKFHYPLEFYAGLLSYDPDKTVDAVREARILGVNIVGPDINRSDRGFTADGDSILYGLTGIKQVGDKAIEVILANRPYTSLDDFKERVPAKQCNSRVRQSLIDAGAFDCFGERNNWDDDRKEQAEIAALGMSFTASQNFRNKYMPLLQKKVWSEAEVSELHDGEGVTVGGEIINTKIITTKTNKKMAFLDLSFGANDYNVTVFPDIWEQHHELITQGRPIIISGRKDKRGTITADEICSIRELYSIIEEG